VEVPVLLGELGSARQRDRHPSRSDLGQLRAQVVHQPLPIEAGADPLLGGGVVVVAGWGHGDSLGNLPLMPPSLTVGDADSALDERLSNELDSFNFGAVGRDDLRELPVEVEADVHFRKVL
jgi:hypothetical protein